MDSLCPQNIELKWQVLDPCGDEGCITCMAAIVGGAAVKRYPRFIGHRLWACNTVCY